MEDRKTIWYRLNHYGPRYIRYAMEAVIILMVCGSPWLFGAAEPAFRLLLALGLTALCGLWLLLTIIERKVRWVSCPVLLGLAALGMIGSLQLIPLPESLVSIVSPNTVKLDQSLRPDAPELFHGEPVSLGDGPYQGVPFSLYPTATKGMLAELLALFLFYALVRNNISGHGAMRRLAYAALVNASALSLVAIIQMFSSPPTEIFWKYPTETFVFGPFICKNHFPFYVNICLGLGLGVLLSTRDSDRRREIYRGATKQRPCSRRAGHRKRVFAWDLPPWAEPTVFARCQAGLLQLLDRPHLLCLCAMMALSAGAVALSLSRGGILALGGAAIVTFFIHVVCSRRLGRATLIIVVVGMSAGLLSWLGVEAVERRMETVWEGTALENNRLPVWERSVQVAMQFPLVGTGLGTFPFVEPLVRSSSAEIGLAYKHAHNEYLEALVEGGVLRLLVSMAMIAAVYWFGVRAYARYRQRPRGGLILGGLFAFSSIVIHSIGEFGLHIPSIALLAASMTAQLMAVSAIPRVQGRRRRRSADRSPPQVGMGISGVPTVLIMMLLGSGLTGLVGYHFWNAERVQRLRVLALMASQINRADHPNTELNYLRAALELAPDYAGVHADLAAAHLKRYESQYESVDRAGPALELLIHSGLQQSIPTPGVGRIVLAGAYGGMTDAAQGQLARRHLRPALRSFVLARDLCPLLPMPQLRLAMYADRFARSDSPSQYLERVKQLVPFHPEVWYVAGVHELLEENPSEAWASWRRSLQLSDQYLDEILAGSVPQLGYDGLLAHVLPDDARVLHRAAIKLFPDRTHEAPCRVYFRRALALLDQKTTPLQAEDYRTRAEILVHLGQIAEATQAYRFALQHAPEQAGWRLEFARLLMEAGDLHAARRELQRVLDVRSNDQNAQLMLEKVARAIAAGA